jgi:hypothetical protein
MAKRISRWRRVPECVLWIWESVEGGLLRDLHPDGVFDEEFSESMLTICWHPDRMGIGLRSSSLAQLVALGCALLTLSVICERTLAELPERAKHLRRSPRHHPAGTNGSGEALHGRKSCGQGTPWRTTSDDLLASLRHDEAVWDGVHLDALRRL